MNKALNRYIKDWAKAKIIAEDNPRLLIKNSVAFTDECGRRIKWLSVCQEKMLEEGERVHEACGGVPTELMRFIRILNNPACDSCWVSSKVSTRHPECNEKIKEYFDAEESLVNYGLML